VKPTASALQMQSAMVCGEGMLNRTAEVSISWLEKSNDELARMVRATRKPRQDAGEALIRRKK
jgi:hypothetical protein